ncbi:hypothetical protein P1X14_16995 [Sphingomonas sp. AOB5]|uniref:hypothetical protein n=1 Tax=Sphingomonas sp. AOB5 TaxID=3034017 RepID=UPI0023F8D1A6|nr:hypothetical protein [Sphingomonas sp. AOB5]MDF7776956.1 hypothetical protein [Sphingomonas sp. AOB5]
MQALIGASALTAVAVVPPVQGRMLIVSAIGESDAEIAAWALDQGLSIVGRGPVSGSLVAEGPARDVALAALGDGRIVIAAPAAGCGSRAKQ